MRLFSNWETVHLGGLFALKQWISCSLKHDTVPGVNNLYCFYVKSPPPPPPQKKKRKKKNRLHYGIVQVVNKQTTTTTTTRTSPDKRFIEQNNSCARAFLDFAHFLALLCKTKAGNGQALRHLTNANANVVGTKK